MKSEISHKLTTYKYETELKLMVWEHEENLDVRDGK